MSHFGTLNGEAVEDQPTTKQDILLSAFFPPKKLHEMASQMKSASMLLTEEESILFDDVEKIYDALIKQYICRPGMLIKLARPEAQLDDILYSGTMTMLCMFELYLRKGQEELKT